ncbi:hypothetical protein H5410_050971 [Solanum commersonii]|uniref:Uncharacterized protein n=1 Tax=Solanum commersonii TaxID=4109 RepID=A0A9J5WZK0_SOLCO|nr:hypothetical protein H5410_050971 [Solanum commersonii]
MEAEKRNKTKGEQEKGGTKIIQEIFEQEEQWQTHKRKQNKNQEQPNPKAAWRPVSPQHKGTKDNMQKEPTPSGTTRQRQCRGRPQQQNFRPRNTFITRAAASTRKKTTGIDSVLPIPHSSYTKFIENVVFTIEVTGGMNGRCKDNPTNLQEGVTKGHSLTHVLQEVIHIDHSIDLRPPATTTPMKNTQNTSQKHSQIQGVNSEQVQRDSGVKEAEKGAKDQIQEDGNNLKGVGRANQKSDYDVLNSEDEFDEDTQSVNEEEKDVDGDETSAHLIKAFESTFQSESQVEIHTVADQQCLSPRGRKQVRQQTRQASMSTSANSSRPNTRSTNTKGSLERVQNLKKIHNLSMIAILEPFSNNSQLNNYRLQLNMDNAFSNQNGKIWIFWTIDYDCNILESDDQQCKDELRRPLWDRFIHLSTVKIPWCIMEWGIPYNMNKSFEFISVIEASGLIDLGVDEARVWKRLDRAMANDQWLEKMP